MAKKKLHPGIVWEYRITSWIAFLVLIGFVVLVGVPLVIAMSSIGYYDFTFLMILVCSTILLLALVLGEVNARLTYKNWLYEFTAKEIKIEKGIIWKHYTSIPYQRIQNVDIHRGIFARSMGYSSLKIQTAGISGVMMSEGNIPAVDVQEAEKIREFLIKKIDNR